VIRIELPQRTDAAVVHGHSALVECILSLHVAFDRDHHPFAESRVRALRRLDAGLRRRLEGFREVFEADPAEALLAWPEEGNENFDAGLARLAASEPELAEAVAGYWKASFAADWARIEPMLDGSAEDAVRRLADGGVVTVGSPLDETIVASRERPVRFSPSMFVWRRLLVGRDSTGPVTLLYQAPATSRFLRTDAAPAELVEMLSALADDTRLRVLKLIAERPRTAQELAPIVGMSTTGLSKSLRRLADAGLVASRREGYYVVYSLNTAQIRSLPLALEQFLRGGSDSETRAA
jgi:DNA-binding transcriptional ArsR family regulator